MIEEIWERRIQQRPLMRRIDRLFLKEHLLQDQNAKPPKPQVMKQYNTHIQIIQDIQVNIDQTKQMTLEDAMKLYMEQRTQNTKKIDVSGYVVCKKCGEKRGNIGQAQLNALDEGAKQMVICENCMNEAVVDQALG